MVSVIFVVIVVIWAIIVTILIGIVLKCCDLSGASGGGWFWRWGSELSRQRGFGEGGIESTNVIFNPTR